MKIEDQVCSLEQGKAFKKLGVFGLPYFVHIDNLYLKTNRIGFVKPTYKVKEKITDGGVIRFYPAFTLAELSAMLPTYNWAFPIYQGEINPNSDVYQEGKILYQTLNNPTCLIASLDGCMEWKYFGHKTLAMAAAECLIWLLGSGLIAVSDVNKALTD
jgi:hypothetical protein